jgi:polyisoprenoid-binding protein YceI
MTATTQLSELTGDYVLDKAHTRIGFVARQAMVTKVRGQFRLRRQRAPGRRTGDAGQVAAIRRS